MNRQTNELLTLYDGLNEAQKQAVAHGEGPVLVLAGPGSGKTTVIIKRILYLIQIQKIPPEKILVVTFTKEAACSMQRRFYLLFQEECQKVPGSVTVPVVFGTFHSVFYHILRKARHPATENILSSTQKNEIMTELLKKRSLQQIGHYEYETVRVQARDYLDAIGYYKNTCDLSGTKRRLPLELRETFDDVFRKFQENCLAAGGLDFDDMMFACRELLMRDESVRVYWQKRFTHILVDEFQDINPIQYEVLKLFGVGCKNLFAVGDEDQAIYGFRGSAPDCVKRFATEFSAKQILLTANYRSTADIVTCAEKVIAENQTRYVAHKAVYAAGENAGITDSVVLHCFESRQQELDYLTEKLKKDPAQCGVLFRTNRMMQGFAVHLTRQGIPFVMKEKTGNPYEHFVIKDLLAYLKLASGAGSRELFLRIMNRPLRYLSRECVGAREDLDLAKITGQNAKADQELRKLKQQLERIKGMSPGLAITYVSKVIGYEDYLKSQKGAGEHLTEWLEMLQFAKEDALNYETVSAWEAAAAAWNSRDADVGGIPDEADRHISLMTVHASKGLEFEHVYLPDCNEKVYPHGNLPDREAVEEERRIFYVGMTRAKKHLELLCTTGTKERPRQISRFLNPIIHRLHPTNHQSTHQTRNCQDTRQRHP